MQGFHTFPKPLAQCAADPHESQTTPHTTQQLLFVSRRRSTHLFPARPGTTQIQPHLHRLAAIFPNRPFLQSLQSPRIRLSPCDRQNKHSFFPLPFIHSNVDDARSVVSQSMRPDDTMTAMWPNQVPVPYVPTAMVILAAGGFIICGQHTPTDAFRQIFDAVPW